MALSKTIADLCICNHEKTIYKGKSIGELVGIEYKYIHHWQDLGGSCGQCKNCKSFIYCSKKDYGTSLKCLSCGTYNIFQPIQHNKQYTTIQVIDTFVARIRGH